jgi:hypothetical protein
MHHEPMVRLKRTCFGLEYVQIHVMCFRWVDFPYKGNFFAT